MAALKERRDGELLHAGNESRRRHVAFGHEKRHLVARTHSKRVGEVAPENHAEASGFEHRQFGAAPQLRSEVAHGPFRRGIDPLHDGPSHRAPGTQKPLSGHVGRGRNDARHLKDGVRKGMPVVEGAPRPHHLDVRHDAQHAVAHFLLKAVHDAQNDDERRDAERDRGHRHRGDEAHEAVFAAAPPPRSRVGEADE